jgi:hypothetical protein
MDTTTVEESVPLPLPVERQFNNAYINANFNNRNIGAKAQLLINGQVRVLSKEDRSGVQIFMPSMENLDEWKQQSIHLGQKIKLLKDQQNKIHKNDDAQD